MLTAAAHIASKLAVQEYNNIEAFTIMHNAHSVSRSAGPHVHITCLRSRWHKAWYYFVLALKNSFHPIHRLFSRRSRPPTQHAC